ncbi:thioredoxin family protein [Nocardioides sp. NPDC051685]|uniref:thioredoxin family protein n=1 Tax=Nocardioides sp. NPDC051685 TaxID=3364334 RepID=UPI003799D50A
MTSRLVVVIALVLLSAGCGSNAERASDPAPPAAASTPSPVESAPAESPPGEMPAEDPACEAPGRYADYSAEAAADVCYTDTILFFHAPWCPECRGFEEAIESGTVPDGAQILKVDYDSATDLRKKYEVTIQSTFVRVDATGKRIKLWSGYGQDKSVDAILEHTR